MNIMLWKLNFTKITLFAIILFPLGFIINFLAWTITSNWFPNTLALFIGVGMMYLSPILLIISLLLGFIKTQLKK